MESQDSLMHQLLTSTSQSQSQASQVHGDDCDDEIEQEMLKIEQQLLHEQQQQQHEAMPTLCSSSSRSDTEQASATLAVQATQPTGSNSNSASIDSSLEGTSELIAANNARMRRERRARRLDTHRRSEKPKQHCDGINDKEQAPAQPEAEDEFTALEREYFLNRDDTTTTTTTAAINTDADAGRSNQAPSPPTAIQAFEDDLLDDSTLVQAADTAVHQLLHHNISTNADDQTMNAQAQPLIEASANTELVVFYGPRCSV
jgi:hypothetical protein